MQPLRELPEFNKWKINRDHYSLEDGKGGEVFLEPRLLKLLDYLYSKADQVAKRNEIVDHVWADVVVTDESLSKAVFDLRKFLMGNFKNVPRITTIRKVGYKLELKRDVVHSRAYRISSVAIKILVGILVIASLLSIVVRAIRYEN